MAEDDTAGPPLRLVVGLGNPGREYEKTRHNVGFLVLDRLAEKEGLCWSREKKWETEIARGAERIYLKPQTFMNLSGRAVSGVAQFYKIPAPAILVVHDDADLPLGVLRFRVGGSAGGHRGVASVIESLGADEIIRLKIGVGREGRDGSGGPGLADHVLGKFLVDEAPIVEKTLDLAVRAVNDAVSHGVEAAMNTFNRRPEKPKRAPKTVDPGSGPDGKGSASPGCDSPPEEDR